MPHVREIQPPPNLTGTVYYSHNCYGYNYIILNLYSSRTVAYGIPIMKSMGLSAVSVVRHFISERCYSGVECPGIGLDEDRLPPGIRTMALDRGGILRINARAMACVVVAGGRVWITHSAQPGDAILDGGETYMVAKDGVLVMEAMADSDIRYWPGKRY